MARRIFALIFIFACTSVAWWILGGTIFQRTYSADSELKGKVMSSWGAPQKATPPKMEWATTATRTIEVRKDNQLTTREEQYERDLPLTLSSSRLRAAVDLEHRQKGLLWYSTYTVNFAGDYTFPAPPKREGALRIAVKLPAAKVLYDAMEMSVNGVPVPTSIGGDTVTGSIVVPEGETLTLHFAYRSHGLDTWTYDFGGDVAQVKDFHLEVGTNFHDIDFPPSALSPTSKTETAGGWRLNWDYTNLVSGVQIGVAMPEKLQPGPLAGRISFFAPVSLLFFFFLMLIITTMRGIELHPMNYFFLATAFFAFHLLLAYTVDHISIHAAFAICSAVSIFLVVTYLRLVVGLRFALVEAGVAQFVYLVLFSYAFFLKGYTALAVTIGSIITLFVVMQLTGRVRWSEKFAAAAPAPVRAS
ncbi:MAG TPA: inner membrane CreD family protein [Terriglobales bacterium]|nr:inner membrane CreD family protein [Terriglobales bacterium]